MTMDFLNAVADWSVRRKTDVVFQRDEYSEWYARVRMKDSVGPFSAVVNSVDRRTGKSGESMEAYEERVAKMMVDAVVKARKSRIGIRADMEAA